LTGGEWWARFEWRQSTVATYLRCPRRFELQFVRGLEPDDSRSGFAMAKGTASHKGIQHALEMQNRGHVPSEHDIAVATVWAWEDAVGEADKDSGGDVYERIKDETMDVLDVHVPRIHRVATDPRMRHIRWEGLELEFRMVERGKSYERIYRGTIDAVGRATTRIPEFSSNGQGELLDLEAGELIVVDWKTGARTALGRAPRALNTQLAFYRQALISMGWRGARGARLIIGNFQDTDRRIIVRDEDGVNIPRYMKGLNPAWLEALGFIDGEDAKASKKRAKDAEGKNIPKKLDKLKIPNPAYLLATQRPRGHLFHECGQREAEALRTISAAIKGAEAGLFPAAGAANGSCEFCPYVRPCAAGDEDGNQTERD